MKKLSRKAHEDELRPQYDLFRLKAGMRGKYHRQAMAGTNLVLIEPDLARAFPDDESVNRALRIVLSVTNAARGGFRRRAGKATKRYKRIRRKQAV